MEAQWRQQGLSEDEIFEGEIYSIFVAKYKIMHDIKRNCNDINDIEKLRSY